MASLYERPDSPFLWLKFRDASGRVRQVSTRCRIGIGPDIRRARQMAAEKSLEELKEGPRAKSGWGWIGDFLLVRYRSSPPSLERYQCAWGTLQMFLDEREIEGPAGLRREHCFDYVAWRQRPDKPRGKYRAKHNTALLELKTLRLVMREAVERKMISANPCVQLGIKKERTGVKPELSADDCETIRAAIRKVVDLTEREALSNSFEIARYQGCRLSETRLDPTKDVNLTEKTITFRAKGDKDHVTRLHPKLVGLFKQLRAEGKSKTWQIPEGRGRQWASSLWWRFLDGLGLKAKGITFHSTRVTVISEMARNNVHESKAKSFVGHSSTSVHEIYQRLRPKDLSDCTKVVG